ncbi:MAG: hypothetical protein OEW15_12345 [Nitrospirota bacterium]|nr:hypothetical protein [Nitrospirota bacterium]
MVRKQLLVLIAVISLFVTASCASNPPKQAAILGEGALTAVRDLTKAYEKRDIEAFMDRIASAYPDRDKFRGSVEKTFAVYQTIQFTVQDTRMLVMVQYQGNVKTVFTWSAEWQTSGGKILKDGGRVTVVHDPSTYKVLAVEGKNPYVPTESAMPVK